MTAANTSKANAALIHVWGQRRVFAATSRKRKEWITRWRVIVLGLTIAGAIFGVSSKQVTGPDWLTRTLGGLSALAVGFAAYFGKEALTTSGKQEWVRARSAAEALKSLTYLYVTRTPPFEKDNAPVELMARTRELEETNSDFSLESLDEQEKQDGIPSYGMTVDQYIDKRIKDQKDTYYTKQISRNQKRLTLGNNTRLALGGLAVLLGGLKAMGVPFNTAVWVAVTSTVSASIASFLFAERYSYLSLSYQSTARRLDRLLTEWEISEKSDTDRIKLITECENTISIENKTWLAEWGKRDKTEDKGKK